MLAALRERALESAADRTTSVGLFEWSAPDGCDLTDRQAWAQANPALGWSVTEEALEGALATDPEPVFRTEVLNQWVAEVDTAWQAGVWQALADPRAARGRGVVFALDLAPQHETATIAAAWQRPDGASHVVVAEHAEGVEWVIERAVGIVTTWGGRLVVESSGTAAWLLPSLERAGVTVEQVPRRFYADACGSLDAAITARRVRHGGEPVLQDAVRVARWSTTSNAGTRVLSRKDPRVSPLVAAALALHGLTLKPARTGAWMVGL